MTITIILSFLCSRTKMDYNQPNLRRSKDKNHSCCEVLCSAVFLHHSLISAFIGPKKGNLYTTPKQYNQMIFAWVYFFIICVLQEFIMHKQDLTTWERNKIIGLDLIVFAIFWALKMFAHSVSYRIYFKYYKIQQNFDDIRETEQYSLKVGDKTKTQQ